MAWTSRKPVDTMWTVMVFVHVLSLGSCADIVVNGNSGSFFSANYPAAYDNDIRQVYRAVLTTPGPQQIRLDYQIDIEAADLINCHDWLEIPSYRTSRMCGIKSGTTYLSITGDTFNISFITDQTVKKTGFNLTFTVLQGNCNPLFVLPAGAPGYAEEADWMLLPFVDMLTRDSLVLNTKSCKPAFFRLAPRPDRYGGYRQFLCPPVMALPCGVLTTSWMSWNSTTLMRGQGGIVGTNLMSVYTLANSTTQEARFIFINTRPLTQIDIYFDAPLPDHYCHPQSTPLTQLQDSTTQQSTSPGSATSSPVPDTTPPSPESIAPASDSTAPELDYDSGPTTPVLETIAPAFATTASATVAPASISATPAPDTSTPATTPAFAMTTPSSDMTTPTSGRTAAASDSTTPASDSTTPESDSTTPVPDSTTPVPDSTTPASDIITPASDSTTPESDSTTPASDNTTPASDSTTPASDSTTPASDSTTPVTDSTTPASDGISPASDGTSPASDITTPASDIKTPASDSTTPAFDSTTPASDTSTHASDRTPATDTITPVSDTTVPASESRSPSSETITPASDTTVPASESRSPSSDTITPASDSTTPASDGTTHSDQTTSPVTTPSHPTHTSPGLPVTFADIISTTKEEETSSAVVTSSTDASSPASDVMTTSGEALPSGVVNSATPNDVLSSSTTDGMVNTSDTHARITTSSTSSDDTTEVKATKPTKTSLTHHPSPKKTTTTTTVAPPPPTTTPIRRVTSVTYSREQCLCNCVQRPPTTQLTLEQREESLRAQRRVVESLQQELTVSPSNVSASVRRKKSAGDERRSSQWLGLVTGVVCLLPLLAILLVDCLPLAAYVLRVVNKRAAVVDSESRAEGEGP